VRLREQGFGLRAEAALIGGASFRDDGVAAALSAPPQSQEEIARGVADDPQRGSACRGASIYRGFGFTASATVPPPAVAG
jgi:hypothetical protein